MTASAPTRWGSTWLELVAGSDSIDAVTLARGRGAVGRGAVRDLEIEPASVRANVAGRRDAPHRVHLGLARFTDGQWEDCIEYVASSRVFVAAVLDGDLPAQLVAGLDGRGCGLLPRRHEVLIDCDCGNTAGACMHCAAVWWAMAETIDADPLVLVTLRGGDRRTFLDGLRTEPPGASARSGRAVPDGVSAATAWKRTPDDLPALDHRRLVARRPRSVAQAPPAELGFDQAGLDRLVRDASHRAVELLRDGAATGLELDRVTDAVRRVAAGTLPRVDLAAVLGSPTGSPVSRRERVADSEFDGVAVDALVDTWRHVGAPGVDAIVSPRRLTPSEVAQVRALWGEHVRERSTGALLADGRQVRRSADGMWVVVQFVDPGGWHAVAASDSLDDLSPA